MVTKLEQHDVDTNTHRCPHGAIVCSHHCPPVIVALWLKLRQNLLWASAKHHGTCKQRKIQKPNDTRKKERNPHSQAHL